MSKLKMVSYIALPVLSEDKIVKLLDWHDSVKTVMDNKGGKNLDYPWMWSQIRDGGLKTPTEVPETLKGNSWNADFVRHFPELVLYFNCLPLSNVVRIVLLETVKPVLSHTDYSSTYYLPEYEPANYRMTLRSSIGPGFYVQALDPQDCTGPSHAKPSRYPRQHFKAKPGHWWTLNNSCCQHGSEYEVGDRKVLISVQGEVSPYHLELLKIVNS